jgi:hypothetical protein
MDRQTLRDWVHRYNAAGVDGVASRKPPGAAAKLTASQMAELRDLVIAGPDRKTHKVIRWRCVDLCAEVTRRFAVTEPERTANGCGRCMDGPSSTCCERAYSMLHEKMPDHCTNFAPEPLLDADRGSRSRAD